MLYDRLITEYRSKMDGILCALPSVEEWTDGDADKASAIHGFEVSLKVLEFFRREKPPLVDLLPLSHNN